MSGDQTRFTFKPQKHYSNLLMQQGRVQLDSDWNEAQAISDRRWRAETLDLLGQAAVPEITPDAFRIQSDGAGSVTIGLGRIYVDGLLAENHGLDPQQYNAPLGELYGTKPTPYSQQPYCPQPPALSAAGLTDLLYLDVWQREVTVLEDPAIQEIALGGPDTATRLQTVWQVKALTDVGTATCGANIPKWDALTQPSAGRLTTLANQPPSNKDPCIIPPKAGYKGLENRLYRVEIQVGGGLGTAKFKWSRDNGSIASAVEQIAAGTAGRDHLTVRRIGRDSVLRFKVGDWVEVLDDAVEFSDSPVGHLAKVTDIDETNRVLVINPPIPASFSFPTTAEKTDPARHTRVRRWDQKHEPDGLLSVSAGPVDLEDGIKVSFSVDSAIGTDFKVGDTWVFAARAADASVELLVNASPSRILHHYARLALVTKTGTETQITDCRTLFPTARCCIVVRPGEDIQAAINKLCKTGGCICLAAGVHPLSKPLLINGCHNLMIHGLGNATRLVYSSANVEADVNANANAAMIYVVGSSQNIWLEDFLGFADGLDALVAVDEDSQRITLDHLTLINANLTSKTTCILLGNCCRVSVTESTLLGKVGLLQTDAERLKSLRNQIASARPPIATPNAASLPPVVATLRGLKFNSNTLYVVDIGVSLEDALNGSISHNQLQGLPSDFKFSRSDEPRLLAAIQINLLGQIDKLLSLLACPPAKVSPALVRSYCLFACLLDKFEIADNQMQAVQGIFLCFSRDVNITGNRIESSSAAALEQKKENAAIAIAFGFYIQVQRNVIHSSTGQLTEQKRSELAQDYLSDRANAGHLGIALGSVRGITLSDNEIHSMSGIGTVRWIVEDAQVQGADAYPEALLRVLGIGRAWRVFVELAWVIWQFIQIARRSPNAGSTPPANPITRPQFAILLVEGLVKLLTAPDLIPNFVGKATIAENQMQVSRFGICFPSIFSVGGLQILGNRISGFTETGILVHPWLSVSFPDLTAQLLYCGLEWILGVLMLLRNALESMLKGKPPAETSGAGNWTAAEIGVALVSWTVSFCAKYCGAEPPGDTPGEQPPPSPSDDLKDALDDLLNSLELAWLDDLVNQSYIIDRNTLRGSGDGIWMGIDGSQISHNHVTIHPANPAPFETIVLGIVMRLSRISGNLVLLPYFLVEIDRDQILSAALLIDRTPTANLNLSIDELRLAINTFLPTLSSVSLLQLPAIALRDALQDNNPNAETIKAAFVALLAALVQNAKGYGIALMGADMTCIHNQVYGTTSCGVEALTSRARIGKIVDRRLPPVVRPPAIAGIWQFSNVLNLSFEIFAVAGRTSSPTAVQPKRVGRSLNLISLAIAYFVLLARKDRGMHLQSNIVETALAYGIRTLDVTGLEEVSILDNTVKNAGRYAIAHQSLISQDQKCCVKVHRNTVTRSNQVFDILSAIPNLNQ